MKLKDRLNNRYQEVKVHSIKYSYIYYPLIGLSLFFGLKKLEFINLDKDFRSNLIGISGTMAGFLFTSLGIIIAIPNNKFMQFIKKTGYMSIIYKSLIIGIITLLVAMLLGLFNINGSISTYFFIVGISETILSAYYLYKVSYYSGKSA